MGRDIELHPPERHQEDYVRLSRFGAAAAVRPLKGNGTAPVKQHCGWADIQVGAIVLGATPPRRTEWFECVVIAVEGEDLFTLRYCDWPKEPPFKRRRVEIGLMHPAYQPEPPLEPELPLWVA
jgi:hypothetical protein